MLKMPLSASWVQIHNVIRIKILKKVSDYLCPINGPSVELEILQV
jgi:hypothetical protein